MGQIGLITAAIVLLTCEITIVLGEGHCEINGFLVSHSYVGIERTIITKTIKCYNFSAFPTSFPNGSDHEEPVGKLEFGSRTKAFNNTFEIITEGELKVLFQSVPNLTNLALVNCAIRQIDKKAFKGGDKIISLDLSNNFIENLDLSVFADLSNLEHLTLDGNPLGRFEKYSSFPKMKLRRLLMNNCEMTFISENLFQNLESLMELELADNNLKNVKANVFANLKILRFLNLENNQLLAIDPGLVCRLQSLNKFNFKGNPIKCDCDLFSVINLLKQKNVEVSKPNCSSVSPAYPKASNESLSVFASSKACPVSGELSTFQCREFNKDKTKGRCGEVIEENGAWTDYFCEGYRNELPKLISGYFFGPLNMGYHSNNIRTLESGVLLRSGLTYFMNINLEHCQIQEIELGAFEGNVMLFSLLLGDNLLEHLDPAVFENMPALTFLSLEKNPIKYFKRNSRFPELPEISRLELNNCELEWLEEGLFDNFRGKTANINLEQNKLVTLDVQVLRPTSRSLTFSLTDNPWVCDCKLKEVIQRVNEKTKEKRMRNPWYWTRRDPSPECLEIQTSSGKNFTPLSWDRVDVDTLICWTDDRETKLEESNKKIIEEFPFKETGNVCWADQRVIALLLIFIFGLVIVTIASCMKINLSRKIQSRKFSFPL